MSSTNELGAAAPSFRTGQQEHQKRRQKVRRPMVRASQTDPSKRDIQAHIDAGRRKERPPRLPDVLIAEAEGMASSRSSPRAVRR